LDIFLNEKKTNDIIKIIWVHHPLTPSQEGESQYIGGDTPLPGSIGMLHLPLPLARKGKGLINLLCVNFMS
jgi:hypothetical protein